MASQHCLSDCFQVFIAHGCVRILLTSLELDSGDFQRGILEALLALAAAAGSLAEHCEMPIAAQLFDQLQGSDDDAVVTLAGQVALTFGLPCNDP
jgi:hypothetical protein